MAQALILDSEAVSALANANKRGAAALRARAILSVAHQHRALVRVPAPVLAEVCRSPALDAAINHILNDRGIGVCELTRSAAQRAGQLLGAARLSSRHAVDAFVVATALEFESSVIATADPKDIGRLIGSNKAVTIFTL